MKRTLVVAVPLLLGTIVAAGCAGPTQSVSSPDTSAASATGSVNPDEALLHGDVEARIKNSRPTTLRVERMQSMHGGVVSAIEIAPGATGTIHPDDDVAVFQLDIPANKEFPEKAKVENYSIGNPDVEIYSFQKGRAYSEKKGLSVNETWLTRISRQKVFVKRLGDGSHNLKIFEFDVH